MNFLHFDGLNFKFPKKPLKITFFEWSPPTEILSGISILTFYLALYLTYIYWLIDWLVGWLVDWLIDWLTFYLTYILTFYILTGILSGIWHLFWHSISHSMWHLALAIEIPHSPLKKHALAVKVRQCHLALALAVEVRQCPLRSGARGWGWNPRRGVEEEEEERRRGGMQLW